MNPTSSRLNRIANLSLTNTVFFLCDVQESYRSTVYQFDSVVSTVQKMADAAEILDVNLWVKATAPTIFGSTVEDLDLRNADSQISTSRFSMCDELVNRSLKDRNLQNVILFGLEAHISIAQTAVDLMNESIEVYILHDAVSSRNQGEIPIALKRLENLGATITTSEAILFQLVRHTAHPKFEAISELVEKYAEETKKNMLLNCLNATNYYKSNDLMKEYLKQLQTSRNELSSIISSSSQLGALSKIQTSEQLTSESLTFPFPIPSLFMPDLTHTSNIIPSESQTEIRQPAKENRDYYPPKNNVSSTDIVPANTTNDSRKRLHSQSISYSFPNPVFQAPKYAVIPLQSSKYLPPLPSHATTQMISPFQESFVFATADNDDASKKDKKRRRARTCSICLSQDCPGRGGRMHCQYTKDSK